MANIGYIQVVRHCNHLCGFCSNPTTPYTHTFDTMKVLVDDLVARGYFGVILTGGEPTLHPDLPAIARYASERGLHVRMITNGTRLAEPDFAAAMAEAGLKLVHVSVYSVRPEIEARLRGSEGTLERAFKAVENAHAHGVEVNINCVINKHNADHLDENIQHWIDHHPYIRHFIWNNLDPSMGRAEVNQQEFTPRLADFEASLYRALSLLHRTGRTFRVEKVPLCYMTDFAWASTETRKIVKGEERIVHFLDRKQTVRQTDWEHIYAEGCASCTLRPICGGLFDRGQGYDPAELAPVFVPLDPVVEKIITDPGDPSYPLRTLAAWRDDFDRRLQEARAPRPVDDAAQMRPPDAPTVGLITPESLRRFEARRRSEARRAESVGISMEQADPGDPPRSPPEDQGAVLPSGLVTGPSQRHPATTTLRLDSAEELRQQLRNDLRDSFRPILVVLSGNQMGQRVKADRSLLIGRDPSADLVLTDAGVSWRHARLEDRGDAWVLVDLKSTNGTSVNGKGGTEFSLHANDKLIFARTVVRFEVPDKQDEAYNEHLEQLLNIDDLSGLYVRRRFDNELAALLSQARLRNEPLGLLVMDMDGIKKINDTHGHLFGAYTIGEAGHLIGRVIERRGIGCRFGGDEFLAALPGLDKAAARAVADEIHAAINNHTFSREGVTLSPGISIGVGSFPEDAPSHEALFQHADEALYRAKQSGKNRVCL